MTHMQFVYDMQPGRVVFGEGALQSLPAELELMGCHRGLVLSTPQQAHQAEDVRKLLDTTAVGTYTRATMHVPVETQIEAAAEAARLGADSTVAIGGGSTVGLAKAIALKIGLPILAIPTTYAGSEMTAIWGLTENRIKRTGRDPVVRPRTVIYDPRLTLSLPPHISAASGINAIAHCVEALYAENANPVVSLMAEEGIRSLAKNLPRICAEPANLEARSEALYGAWLAGAALGSVGMALHHKICHTLGGTFNLPHAETHTAILPHVVAFNHASAPAAMDRISRALNGQDAAGGLFDLAVQLELNMALKDLGLAETDLDRAAEVATQNPYFNPAPVTKEGVRALLDDAFHGRRP